MADFTFNIAKGRVVELYNRVDQNDPANSALILVILRTSGLASDATLIDLDTLAAVLSASPEVANTGYARKTLTDSDIASISPDDTNNRMDLDLTDQTFSAIVAGDGWSKAILCYDPDTTGGTDANIIPLLAWDSVAVPDGNDIQLVFHASGIFRAS